MTPSAWNSLDQEPGTASKSKNNVSIYEDPSVDKTASKNSPSISKHRLDKTVENVTVTEVGLLRHSLGKKGIHVHVVGSGKNILSRSSIPFFPVECHSSRCLSESCERPRYVKNTSDLSVATKLRSDCDLEKLSVKKKQEGMHSRCHLEPIFGHNRLNFSNTNCDNFHVSNHSVTNTRDQHTVFLTSSDSSYHPISPNFPFLNGQSLLKYSSSPVMVPSSDGTIQSSSARSKNKEATDDSIHREPNYNSKVHLDAETTLVPLQSSTAETRASSFEDLKTERSNASTDKCPKLWRPFLEENCESRPSSTGSNEIHVPVPHYVRLRAEFKDYAMTSSPSGIGVLRGSSTSSFRPVRRKRSLCNFCPMSFNNNGQLAGHMRIHTGDKPFKCDSCAKAFARNEELTRHKRIHSGLRPHVCDICSKKFGRKDHLNKHRKTHLKTSEKKIFHCRYEGCGHSYTRSDALTRHQSTAHNIRQSSQQNYRGGPRARAVQKRQDVVVGP